MLSASISTSQASWRSSSQVQCSATSEPVRPLGRNRGRNRSAVALPCLRRLTHWCSPCSVSPLSQLSPRPSPPPLPLDDPIRLGPLLALGSRHTARAGGSCLRTWGAAGALRWGAHASLAPRPVRGLRGALPVVIGISVTEEFQFSFPLRNLVLGVVAVTLIVQGLTQEPVCRRVWGPTCGSAEPLRGRSVRVSKEMSSKSASAQGSTSLLPVEGFACRRGGPADLGRRLADKRLKATCLPVETSGLDGQALPFGGAAA